MLHDSDKTASDQLGAIQFGYSRFFSAASGFVSGVYFNE